MHRQAPRTFGLTLAAVIALLAAAPGSARQVGRGDDLYVLTPANPVLPKATVGQQPGYGASFRVTYDGKPAEGALIGCDLSRAADPAVQFNDCAKLPPGLSPRNAQGCSNNDNGCLLLDGVPTKAGTYKFRIAALGGSNGGYLVREYTLVVQPAPKYDLDLDWSRDNKSQGETRITFTVGNIGDARSVATTVDFDTEVRNTDKKVTFSAVWRGTDFHQTECKRLVCTIPALTPKSLDYVYIDITAKIHVKNVREGGTYVKIRGDIACDEKDEKSCTNNHAPAPPAWHKTIVGS